MARPLALIAGASGLIGRRVAQRLLELGDWDVVGLARRPGGGNGMRWLAVDLTDAADCRRKLAGLAVTHLFYTARADHYEGAPERGAGIGVTRSRGPACGDATVEPIKSASLADPVRVCGVRSPEGSLFRPSTRPLAGMRPRRRASNAAPGAPSPDLAIESGQDPNLRPASTQAFVAESADINAAMLSNVVDALAGGALEHVHAVHGSKYYGHQLGPVALPMREEGPRAAGQNFYFVQEDFLRSRSRAEGWSYTLTRPHTFCDAAVDMPRSIGLLIAVYAAVQRELGLPLDFPGNAKAYEARTQFTDIGLLARAIVWMANEPRCADQAFNIVNGDCPRWSELWPEFARVLGVEPGRPLGIDLAQYMADKRGVWRRIVTRHALRETALDELVLWPYGNYVFKPEWDIMSSTEKAHAFGFDETLDTGSMFARQFDHYRAEKIIPGYRG